MTTEEKNNEEKMEEEEKEQTEEKAEAAEEPEEKEEQKEEKEEKEEEEGLETKYMRLMADFQNFRKRTEKEKADVYAYANEAICTELLDVADNFERALGNMEDANDAFYQGMEMIFKQLKEVLNRAHVEEIEAEGKEFDPKYHNAVMMEEVEGTETNTVTEVLQKGYTLNSKVIRPAMVKVAK